MSQFNTLHRILTSTTLPYNWPSDCNNLYQTPKRAKFMNNRMAGLCLFFGITTFLSAAHAERRIKPIETFKMSMQTLRSKMERRVAANIVRKVSAPEYVRNKNIALAGQGYSPKREIQTGELIYRGTEKNAFGKSYNPGRVHYYTIESAYTEASLVHRDLKPKPVMFRVDTNKIGTIALVKLALRTKISPAQAAVVVQAAEQSPADLKRDIDLLVPPN